MSTFWARSPKGPIVTWSGPQTCTSAQYRNPNTTESAARSTRSCKVSPRRAGAFIGHLPRDGPGAGGVEGDGRVAGHVPDPPAYEQPALCNGREDIGEVTVQAGGEVLGTGEGPPRTGAFDRLRDPGHVIAAPARGVAGGQGVEDDGNEVRRHRVQREPGTDAVGLRGRGRRSRGAGSRCLMGHGRVLSSGPR